MASIFKPSFLNGTINQIGNVANQATNAITTQANKTGQFVDTLVNGRTDIPPLVKDYLAKHGNEMITSIIINRAPVVI